MSATNAAKRGMVNVPAFAYQKQCTFVGGQPAVRCPRRQRANGLCNAHDQQRRAGRDLTPLLQPEDTGAKRGCDFLDAKGVRCPRPHNAHGLCATHDKQRRAGLPLTPVPERRPPGSRDVRDSAGRAMCRDCGRWLAEDRFHKKLVGVTCGPCTAMYYRLRKYGLTPVRLRELFDWGGGACWSCGRPAQMSDNTGWLGDLQVDHDHTCCPGNRSCGLCVRGLLCPPHNRVAGHVGDDPGQLRDLATYLTSMTPAVVLNCG